MNTPCRTTPSNILMAIAGDASPTHLVGLALWLLLVAFAAGCVVAAMGVVASLRALVDGLPGMSHAVTRGPPGSRCP